ncbi:ABC transporter [Frigoribacterium sp. CFBP 8766]|uniref:ABC transporter n=1 Tax=Frigoribacterium sp. CFBP 8766 TaxID=2775273 RepID=UPI0017818FDA|nr:ABC transporter [Frigoribacterium sp. CFBP 8766]MBD8585385.1 ABC transporter [Frigoribacterium sp. CFBP 8766]
MTRRTALLPAALVTLLALAACSPGTDSADDAGTAGADETAVPHGYVEGARELQEPQLRLVALDGDVLSALDPASGEIVELASGGSLGDASSLTTDGRHLFAATPDGRLTVVDGGAWTVPHGDHSHYYLADPRVVAEPDDLADLGVETGTGVETGNGSGSAAAGASEGSAQEVRAASSASVTAASWSATGTGLVLDGDALADGELDAVGRIEGTPHDGVLVPLGDQLIASVVSDAADASDTSLSGSADASGPAAPVRADTVVVTTAEGEPVDGLEEPCPALRGSAATRVGVVVGCADGAVLATADSAGDVTLERIPYPAGTAASDVAASFQARPGRPAVASVAGTRGAWLLDTRARTWTLIETPEPLLRATAVGDSDDTVVAVDTSGRVVVLSPEGVLAQTEPLVAADLVAGADGPELPAGVVLEVDASRSYLNSPSAGVVHEIDHADSARVARTLPLPGRLVVETGR